MFSIFYRFIFRSQDLAFMIACFDGVEVIMWRKKRNSSEGPHTKANYSW